MDSSHCPWETFNTNRLCLPLTPVLALAARCYYTHVSQAWVCLSTSRLGLHSPITGTNPLLRYCFAEFMCWVAATFQLNSDSDSTYNLRTCVDTKRWRNGLVTSHHYTKNTQGLPQLIAELQPSGHVGQPKPILSFQIAWSCKEHPSLPVFFRIVVS